MKQAARRTNPDTNEICAMFFCEECPIGEDCDTYQQHRFEERDAIYRATMIEHIGADAPIFRA